MDDETTLTRLTMQVVAAYGSLNRVRPTEIEAIVQTVRACLDAVGRPPAAEPPAATPALTRAQIRRSITPDGLVSFEDGKRYKQLKRHLAAHGLTPADYIAKWGLPADYPMVAASLSAARSAVALRSGFGRKPPAAPAIEPAPPPPAEPEPPVIMQPPEPEPEPTPPAPPVVRPLDLKAPRARVVGRLSLFGPRSVAGSSGS